MRANKRRHKFTWFLILAPKSLQNTMRSSIGEIISKMWDLHCHERLLAKRKLGSSEDERDGRQILERITDGGLPPTQSESSNSPMNRRPSCFAYRRHMGHR
ncbi:hypothetical protein M408DRAFT_177852 [Serendipita vermifera MAFF 305830]|uniref:Uncharacterized protein n=1 Tax=Serendipita vermifera MAFF 305830 TaxID=933852 RepID=A0A0C2XCB1_SERVB|nr:hypothetical protein M408DRAFT_177852 [Serendipita vermifera MAFF 305830]